MGKWQEEWIWSLGRQGQVKAAWIWDGFRCLTVFPICWYEESLMFWRGIMDEGGMCSASAVQLQPLGNLSWICAVSLGFVLHGALYWVNLASVCDASNWLKCSDSRKKLIFFSLLLFRGERYIGTWLDDHRHGQGIVVTQSGVCYQRTFHADKMVVSIRFQWTI